MRLYYYILERKIRMNKQSLLKRLFASAAAAAILAAALAGCGGAADTHKGLDASLEHAKEAVKNYSSSLNSMTFEFSDDAYSKASVAATLLSEKNGEEEMQAAARNLKLDTIVIADEKGVVTASYPDDLKGKNIKETDYKAFNKVVKGIAVKLMPDPVKVQDSGEYNVNAAVPRANGSGAVIIGYKTKDYADITGENLTNYCGVNTVVGKDGTILSTSFKDMSTGEKTETVGVTEENIAKDTFEMKQGDNSFVCKGAKVGDYIVVCGEPK